MHKFKISHCKSIAASMKPTISFGLRQSPAQEG